LRIPKFDCYILPFDKTGFIQASPEGWHEMCNRLRRTSVDKSITGIAGCCARAASGNAVEAAIP
jgi:hypothetical protein